MFIPKKFSALLLGGLLLSFLFIIPLWADPEISASTDLSLQVSTRPEVKLRLIQNFTFPFLRGSGPLTADNNIKTTLIVEVSPISVNGIAELTWTPIAFFQLIAGGKAGSGWNIPAGNGIGINECQPDGTGEIKGEPFEGLLWNAYGGAALQFDLAALLPGDWNHVVFRTYHEGRYKGYTGASGEESWIFENDDGENRNGFNYYGNYLLGYQMPLSPFLNTVGFLAEVDQYLYNTPGGEAWGDDLGRWYFSLLFNFTITKNFGAALIVQTQTRRNYGSSDLENQDRKFYQDQILVKSDPYRLIFYRAALIMTLNLH
jgi:hypothetical protein